MVGGVTTIADGGYRGTGLFIPRRAPGARSLRYGSSNTTPRIAVSVLASSTPSARMKTWKSLRDCRLKGEGVHHASRHIAYLHYLARRA